MKAVFISYNQALTDRVNYLLDRLSIRGYTKFDTVYGRGSFTGEPHLGTHTWPAMNSAILTMIDDEQLEPLMEALRKLDDKVERQGMRAFYWTIEGGL